MENHIFHPCNHIYMQPNNTWTIRMITLIKFDWNEKPSCKQLGGEKNILKCKSWIIHQINVPCKHLYPTTFIISFINTMCAYTMLCRNSLTRQSLQSTLIQMSSYWRNRHEAICFHTIETQFQDAASNSQLLLSKVSQARRKPCFSIC